MTRQLARQLMSVAAIVALVVAVVVPQYSAAASRPAGNITGPVALPSFHRGGEALAVDARGTIIVGSAWDVSSRLHAVKWTLQGDGSWALTDLAWPPGVSSTIARGVNNRGDVAGNDFPASTSRPLLWPAGTSSPRILGCSIDPAESDVYGISANAQVVVGDRIADTQTASVWRPDGTCREDLPLLAADGGAVARAVNGDGTIVGGIGTGGGGSGVPIRWTNVAGQWRIEELDFRSGIVFGANASGDFAGFVTTPCEVAPECQHAVIWYANGESHEFSILVGDQSVARDINSAGEIVGNGGTSTSTRGTNTPFFWSPDPAVGTLQLPFKGRWATANALSDVRPDGSRLVVGQDSRNQPVTWVVRNP